MCMKNVNATVSLYKNVVFDQNRQQNSSFNGPFDGIVSKISDSDSTRFIEDFAIVTQINLIGTPDSKDEKNVIDTKGSLDVMIRLTKCDKIEDNRLAVDLDKFEIDTVESSDQIEQACLSFMSYRRITQISSITLPEGSGTYVIKVLVKRKGGTDDYKIQSMYQLRVA